MEQVATLQTLPCTLEKQQRHFGNGRYSALRFMLRQRIAVARWLNRDDEPTTSDPADTSQPEHFSKELHDITALYNLAVSIGSSLELDDLLWKLYKESSLLVDTTNFATILYEPETARSNFGLVINQGQRRKPRSVELSQSQSLINRVLTDRTPLLVSDLPADNAAPVNQVDVTPPVRSWLGVPILNPTLTDEEVQGVIAIWSDQPNAFTEHDLWLLSAIGTQASIAIRNARLYEASQRQAAENAKLHQTVLAGRDRVIAVQEQARKALASELHDGPTQLVSAILMHLDFSRILLQQDPSRLAEEIAIMQDLAQRTIHQLRTLLFELRPLALETQGLVAALKVFVERRREEIIDQTRLTLDLQTGQISWPDKKVEAALFAMVQEAVNNAIKHAKASEISVQLKETDNSVCVTISDDGRGFDVESVLANYEQGGSLGMVNLHERAELIGADLTLKSAPGRGTKVTAYVSKSQ